METFLPAQIVYVHMFHRAFQGMTKKTSGNSVEILGIGGDEITGLAFPFISLQAMSGKIFFYQPGGFPPGSIKTVPLPMI